MGNEFDWELNVEFSCLGNVDQLHEIASKFHHERFELSRDFLFLDSTEIYKEIIVNNWA